MIKSASNLRNLIADTEKVADSGETVFARLTDNEKLHLMRQIELRKKMEEDFHMKKYLQISEGKSMDNYNSDTHFMKI